MWKVSESGDDSICCALVTPVRVSLITSHSQYDRMIYM